MKSASVRITNVTIHNLKNVMNGSLSFENGRKNYRASILGLYGQNGSGKTALIDSLELLKHALCGGTILVLFVASCFQDKRRDTPSFG
jgi:AAA15 family ATPase/GTPase